MTNPRVAPAAASLQLVVMARWPAPGRCKSRLAHGLGRRRAALIQDRLGRHVISVARQALQLHGPTAGGRAVLVLAVDGLGPRAAQRWGQQLQVDRVVLQGAGGLGSRLQRQLSRAAREGAKRIVLIGTDLPGLCPRDLLDAVQSLEAAPWVLGPAEDGGYWLLACRSPWPSPFTGWRQPIAWGTDTVLQETLELASHHGIRVPLLGRQADVDRAEDLRPWR